jgi:clan AA aspartic protease (TIGR02281 family)
MNIFIYIAALYLCLVSPSNGRAEDSDMVKADRQALAEAQASGISSKILAAKEQLSDDLGLEQNRKRQDLEGITIPLVPDGQGHLLANVLINGSVPASLVVDTGSPVVMLTSSFIQKLGLDPSQSTQGYVELLNGKYKAASVSLDSIKLGEAQAQDVPATVLMEDNKGVKDGLLGLSFLSKFHYSLDQSGQKLILKK